MWANSLSQSLSDLGGKNSKLNVVGWALKMSRMCMIEDFRRQSAARGFLGVSTRTPRISDRRADGNRKPLPSVAVLAGVNIVGTNGFARDRRQSPHFSSE